MSRLNKIAAATIALSLLSAPIAFAGEVFVTDEWNQPVFVSGAKGGRVQATMPGQFTNGVPAQSTNSGSPADLLKGSQAWTRQPDARAGQPMNGDDWMNRF
jgi:hypothetical protein